MADNFAWAEDVVAHGLSGLKRLNGYYHDNFIVHYDGIGYLLRVKRPEADIVDIRQLDENDVLRFLEAYNYPAPRLLYESAAQRFSLQSLVPGAVLSDMYPKNVPLPRNLIDGFMLSMVRSHALPVESYKGARVFEAADSRQMAAYLVDYTGKLYKRLWSENPALYDEYDFPQDPLAGLKARSAAVSVRKNVFCHNDIHQHNIVLAADGKSFVLVDWESAMISDPLFDVACHINRSRYSTEDMEYFIDGFRRLVGMSDEKTFRADLQFYLDLEYIKSAMVDVHRLSQNKTVPSSAMSLNEQDIRKTRTEFVLQRARAIWQQ